MSSDATTNTSTRNGPTPLNLGFYAIGDGLFARGVDLNVNDGRVVAFRLHGQNNQLFVTGPVGNSSSQGRVQVPLHTGIYTFKNEEFGKALDMRQSTNEVIGFEPHGGDNQKWIFEQEGGGWIIRNKSQPGTYLALCYDNSYSNGQEVACVDYSRRLIWEVQPAANNTVRLALHPQQRFMTSNRLQGKNLDLDKQFGSINSVQVKLWEHVENASRQRWVMEYEGQSSLSSQLRVNVPTGPVHIVCNRYKNVVDFGGSGDIVHGFELHAKKNQQWIFEPAGSGYAIATLAIDPPAMGQLRYLGFSPNKSSNNSRLVMVNQEDRVIWSVQSAKGNTFRIARMDHPNWCLEMSGPSNRSSIILFSHTVGATQQRWEFVAPGTK